MVSVQGVSGDFVTSTQIHVSSRPLIVVAWKRSSSITIYVSHDHSHCELDEPLAQFLQCRLHHALPHYWLEKKASAGLNMSIYKSTVCG